MIRYVQHTSGTGKKWRVSTIVPEQEYLIAVRHGLVAVEMEYDRPRKREELKYLYLPESEFQPCAPPEEWIDVTESCNVLFRGALMHSDGMSEVRAIFDIDLHGGLPHGPEIVLKGNYRIRKVEVRDCPADQILHSRLRSAFIVEKLRR